MINKGITRLGIVAVTALAIALTATGVFSTPPSASADSGVCQTTGYDFSRGEHDYFSYSRPCPGSDAYYYFLNGYNNCGCGYGNQFYNQYPGYFNQYPTYANQYPGYFNQYSTYTNQYPGYFNQYSGYSGGFPGYTFRY